MPYLIDGHNLIPHVPGLSLQAIDDEMQLVELLQEFCRLSRQQVEVFFDNAPPAQPRLRRFGRLTAYFVPSNQTADQAIQRRLTRLGRAARNWRVVSSDREVQAEAHSRHAQVVSSEDFVQHMQQVLAKTSLDAGPPVSETLSEAELQEWLTLFGVDGESDQEADI
jgi:uncharacterized protein